MFSLEIKFSLSLSSGKAFSKQPSFQILNAKYHYSIKETRIPWKNSRFQIWGRKFIGHWYISSYQKAEKFLKVSGIMSKGFSCQIEESATGQDRPPIRIVTAMNWNISNISLDSYALKQTNEQNPLLVKLGRY